ncbi:CsbD family protein [Sulfuricaulis limicola]|uniref:CsbD family protein n=1 Tax=Sulfuricaulis limicola TaxID=1620215 RepID=UPI0018D4EA2F|nr:CsbD family protein [Sulfuricaulis limicola]
MWATAPIWRVSANTLLIVSEAGSPGMTVRKSLEILRQEAIVNRDQFKGRIKQAKGRIKEISGELTRDKLLEKKGQAQKIGGRIQAGYGDFKDDIQGYNDLEDDIRGYGDSRNGRQSNHDADS